MNILMVNRVLYPRSAGEAAMFCAAEAFEKLGHHVAWFAMEDPRNRVLEDAYVVTPHYHGKIGKLFDRLLNPVYDDGIGQCMADRLKENVPDFALVWDISGSLTWSVVDMLNHWGVPTWVVVNDFRPICPGRWMLADGKECHACNEGDFRPCKRHRCAGERTDFAIKEQRWLREQGIYGLPDGFLVPSAYHREMFEKAMFTVKPIINAELPLSPAAFESIETIRGEFVMYVGSLTPSKGIGTLLKAHEQSVTRFPLVIAGDSPDRAALIEDAKKMQIDGTVKFLGQVPRMTLRKLMANCVCLIVPSECEELAPWALLEAQAMGKPVIAADHGVLPDRVTDGVNGIVYDPSQITNLAQAIDEMVNMDEDRYQKMCEESLSTAKERYAPEKWAERVLDLLYDMTGYGK